jgi:hypothetical protein
MKLGEMPRLVKLSLKGFERQAPSWSPNPYARLDDNTISVGFGHGKFDDDCARYYWTTKEPRWRCDCAACLTDKEEPSR